MSARDIQFTPDGALWTAGTRLYRLDPGASAWTPLSTSSRDAVLVLAGASADTLFVADQGGVFRSLDHGQSFVEVEFAGGDALAVTPGGALVVGGDDPPFIRRSVDRGATWAEGAFAPSGQAALTYALLALPPAPDAPAGRVLAGTVDGVAASDDDGATFSPTPLWGGGAAVVEFASVVSPATGGRRVLAGGYRNAQPYGRAWYSDDGGATWAGEVTFRDVADGGVSYQRVKGVVALGGSSALVILGRGAVYRTDDGGETWALVGRTWMVNPVQELVGAALVGPDGQLYVATARAGASSVSEGWVYRTMVPTTAVVPGAPAAVALALSAVPNPASGPAALTLTLPAATSARVVLYDGLGREVAVVHDGVLAGGSHRLPVDAGRLAPGVYVARVVTEAGVATTRLVVAP